MAKDRPAYKTLPAPRRVKTGTVTRPTSKAGGGRPVFQADSALRRVKAPL